MISIQVGTVLVALAAAQTFAGPQHDPEELAAMQAAAKKLDDPTIKKYLALMKEMEKAQPRLEAIKDEAARDKAEEAAVRAAAAKVGMPVASIGPVGMLISEWFMLQAAPGTPQELFGRRATFTNRFGEGAVKVLGKAEPEIRAVMEKMMRGQLEAQR